jgi:hypothetical protein
VGVLAKSYWIHRPADVADLAAFAHYSAVHSLLGRRTDTGGVLRYRVKSLVVLWIVLASGLACNATRHSSMPPPEIDLSGAWRLCVSDRGRETTTCGPVMLARDSTRLERGRGYEPFYWVRYDFQVETLVWGHPRTGPGHGTITRFPKALRLSLGLPEGVKAVFGGGLHADLRGTPDTLRAAHLTYCREQCTRYGPVVLSRTRS